ncbi:alpha/beta hydrolase [Mycolicibacterium agri]|uniref:Alpha/beta hydrolase n=1 Tax=Mycolicibacterium agri TaxID=36811 RepID=A0A2A7N8C9_MYCAG|nr:alpha/beta hydrolase [Mycolicibacterium agri]PEG40033.1 alpha/beta hydrolase [Mycolicibacterium agri]GFG51534.1 alpha/beta hydrolase [Mycolicibacterium agri]
MTMNAKRRRAHDKLAALPGVGSVRRPVAPGRDDEFDLFYARSGPRSTTPVVIIPGGPGAASVGLYRGLRRHAAARGLDVIMIDHRGVGMSRHDDDGADLPPEALTIDQAVNDVAAVLDDAGADKAVIYGTSYGTYLAAGVGARHPDRVQAMVLDSPVLSARDIDAVRDETRRVLWDGAVPEAADLAPKVRKLVGDGVLTPAAGQLTAAVYGLAGPTVLTRQLDLLLQGRHVLWTLLNRASQLMFERKTPYRNEPDLVGRIGFRELNYGATPDGKPLDPAVAFREMAVESVEFEAEPYDLAAEMPKFSWPTVVISGGRDLITPRSVAEKIVSLIPGAVLVELATAGHSAIDSRERAALDILEATCAGTTASLPARAKELDAKPPGLGVRLLVGALGAAAVVESALPAAIPRALQRVTS